MQMLDPTQIRDHMPVVGPNGAQLGTVDHIDGSYIKLTKDDGGQHHWIPLSWVTAADDAVRLDRSDQQARQDWLAARPDSMTLNSGGIGGTRS
jgi:hypothetical protein